MHHIFFKTRLMPLAILLSLCSFLSACTTTTKDTVPVDESHTENKKNKEVKNANADDDRGFDPCLINAQLAVCNEDANSNSK